MKTLAMPVMGRQLQRLGIGALVVAFSIALAVPLPAVAKDQRVETVKVSQSSKHPSKSVKTKHTKNTKNSKSRTTQTAKTTRKAYKQHHAQPRSAKKNRKSSAAQSAWQVSNEPRQAYYLIPDSVGQVPPPPQARTTRVDSTTPVEATPAASKYAGKFHQVGKASYYSAAFHGKKTASGERYDPNALTCAHGSLPFGCRIRVTNLSNRKAVEVKVNDRGAFHKHGRVIDLSKAAAQEIGMLSSGTAKVQIEVLE